MDQDLSEVFMENRRQFGLERSDCLGERLKIEMAVSFD